MKKLINSPRAVVREMLEGLADLHPELALLDTENVIVRSDLPVPEERLVALVSGGGSGHEPAHAGYVGEGMLTGAISGEVFTSPAVDAVLAGIRACAGPAGAVLIVKNYTGDRMNFGLAAEMARAEGIPVEQVVVADDVALVGVVPDDRRRGIAGTILVHKIAGGAAATGASVAEVAQAARAAAAEVGSMGVALGACTVPAAGRPGFELGDGEIEIGLGIHGEAGVERAPMMPVDALVDRLLATILIDRGFVLGDRVVLLVNGLGGTPPMELAIVARHALAVLHQHGLTVERAWSGTFLTAIEMPGVSLSVMRVDDQRLAFLDAATTAPAWPGNGRLAGRTLVHVPAPRPTSVPVELDAPDPQLSGALMAIAAALETAEPQLTDLDARAGDGDFGATMVRAAEALRALAKEALPAHALLAATADRLRRAIAGSSGPFYVTALVRASRRLPVSPSAVDWGRAFEDAVDAITELGGARPGDRTMIDALAPAANAVLRLAQNGAPLGDILQAAASAAEAGVQATTAMKPRLGRASYLGDRAVGVPDAGATAVAIWLRALANHFG